MKNKLIIGTVLTGMLLGASPVEAMGNAKVEFTSRDNIQVGETFTVSMSVTDINNTYDGVVSIGRNEKNNIMISKVNPIIFVLFFNIFPP